MTERPGTGRVIYAFPTYDNENGNTLKSIFRALIFHLCYTDAALAAMALSQCDAKRGMQVGKWNDAQWKDLLRELISVLHDEPCYIVIDGLDECKERQRKSLLAHIVALAKDCTGVHVFFSSRPEADIEKCLNTLGEKLIVNENNAEDIRAFVRSELELHEFSTRVESNIDPVIGRFVEELP